MFIISFSISCDCLVVIFLILCIIPLRDSALAHSHSSKELNPSFQEDAHFSGRCTSTNLGIHFSLHLVSYLFGTQQQLSQSLVKSSNLRLRKIPLFSGRCTLTYNFHFILLHPSLGLNNSSVTLR